jgi:site-specific recombinase XerD
MTKGLAMESILDQAFSLSLLLRYLNFSKSELNQMDNDLLIGYRDYLLVEHKKGQSSQINRHLRNAIHFLLWLQNSAQYFDKEKRKIISISTDEKYIPAKINVYADTHRRGLSYNTSKLYHEAFLQPSIPRLRKPIPDETLDKLWHAIDLVCKGDERQLRNEIALNLLERLGARRGEIFKITVSDALEGIKSGTIDIHTQKREANHIRKLDLPDPIASKLMNYIDTVRTPLVKQAIKDGRFEADHEMLLVTTFGTPWNPKSINNELKILTKAANIDTSISPHLFRHTRFTKLTQCLRDLDDHIVNLILRLEGGWRSSKSVEIYQHADKFRTTNTILAVENATSGLNTQIDKRALRVRINRLVEQVVADTSVDVSEELKKIEQLVKQL